MGFKKSAALKITVIYAFFGAVWIFFSDAAWSAWFKLPVVFTRTQTIKGLFYVITTSLLLYWLISKYITAREKTEKALRESEERYRKTLDNMLEGCQIIGFDWKYLYVNDVIAVQGRKTKEELLGRTMMETYPGIEKTEMFSYLRRCMEERLPHRTENEFTFPDGSKGWFELSIQPVPEGVFILSQDITERKQMQESLRSALGFNDLLLQSLPVGIDIVDEEGTILYLNKKWLTLFGREAIGKKCWEIYKDDKKQCVKCPLKGGVHIGKTDVLEVEGILGGKIFEIVHTGILYQNKKALLEVFFDVTERKQIEQEIERLNKGLERRVAERTEQFEKAKVEAEQERDKIHTILRSIGDGVAVIDRDWSITHFNTAAVLISGWREEEVLGKHLREVLKFIRIRDRKENISFIEKAIVLGKTHQMENDTVLIRKDGQEVPVGDSASPISVNGKIIGAIVIFRDMTREKESQMLKSDFAYASHQLRTPVNKALWSLELALSEKRSAVMKEKIKIAQMYIKSAGRLNEELVAVSALDQGTVIPKIKNTYLVDVLGEALKLKNKRIKEKNLKMSLEKISAKAILKTDPEIFKNILLELLNNAIECSRLKGEIKINFEWLEEGLLIKIQDFGIGIPKEQQPLVFTKFFRGNNVLEEHIGAGLGLYITREYVKLLKGKIWFESEKNKGTTFFILLPHLQS